MDESKKSLVGMGLTHTEANIYLSGLAAGPLTIQELAQKTKIKRPTIYHAIKTLADKGLVMEKKSGNKSRFAMSAPENIRGLLELQKEKIEERARGLDKIIPLLASMQSTDQKDGISIVQYDGIDGMKTVMDIAFYCKSKHWEIIAPLKNFLRDYDKEYATRYLNARKYHGITARTLWEFTMPEQRELSKEERDSRNPRFMPVAMQGKFNSMMILFDDKIAIFSSYKTLSAVLITSKELHAMFLAMFEGLWEFSEEY